MSTNRVDDAARAVLDGTPLDWKLIESTADRETLGVLEQLKVLSAVADVHRQESAAAPVGSDVGVRTWGHLQILEPVGAGAFGEVFRAWDTRLDREVALKLLPAGSTTSDTTPAIHEGRLLARVQHPNVVTIYGAELIGDRIGLWMEYVRGQTLEQLLRSGHQFSIPDIV